MKGLNGKQFSTMPTQGNKQMDSNSTNLQLPTRRKPVAKLVRARV